MLSDWLTSLPDRYAINTHRDCQVVLVAQLTGFEPISGSELSHFDIQIILCRYDHQTRLLPYVLNAIADDAKVSGSGTSTLSSPPACLSTKMRIVETSTDPCTA